MPDTQPTSYNLNNWQLYLSGLLDHIDYLIIFLSNNGQIMELNSKAELYFSCKKADVLDMDYENFCKSRKKEVIFNQKCLLNKSTNPTSIFGKDSMKWTIVHLKDIEKNPKGFLILGKDVSSFEKIQEKMIQDYLESISSCMPGNFYWKDKEGRYLDCNQSLLKILGLSSKSDIVGKSDFDLWPDQAEELRKNDKHVMATGKPIYIEETVDFHPEGKMYFTVIKMPLLDTHGNTIGIIGNSLDITELKRTQMALKKANENAEAAIRAKSEFIANMSHDVKTPLSGLIGMAELLTYELEDPKNLDFAQSIYSAGCQLMNFFDNCLELAKSESGNLYLSKDHFRIDELITEITELFHPAIQSKDLSFYVQIDKNIPEVLLGSRAGIYRIILNLVGNAVKFTHTGSVTLKISHTEATHNSIKLKIIVIDTGIGIPKDKQQIIFQRFTRLVPSYKGTYEGTGIGLHIVQKFIQAMGGKIDVSSKIGKGSRFTVILPLEIPSSATNEFTLNQLSTNSSKKNIKNKPRVFPNKTLTRSSNSDQIHILLVEDNIMAQKIAVSILNSLNCAVDLAEDGKTALELFECGKYALIFMDIGLPDMPGNWVAQNIRKIENANNKSVPIIALTAHATESVKKECLDAGMDEVLNKPLSAQSAKAIIVNYVKNKLAEQKQSAAKIKKKTFPKKLNPISPSALPIIEADTDKLLLTLLIESLPEFRGDMEKARQSSDIDSLIKTAHKMHGGLCYTGTPQLREAVRNLEISLKKGELDQLDKLYQQVLQAIDAFEAAYKEHR